MENEKQSAILFYDGECGLCSRSVRFLMKRDKKAALKFAPIQGETATRYLSPSLREQLSTVIYYRPSPSGDDGSQRLLRSEAILCALIDTGSAWRWPARVAHWLPRSWRDIAYDWVARNRHRFFPKGSCALPNPGEEKKLLP
jgi:predicted DCC family thiol-disulfide oxidoreductase YuxK